jgi:tRNA pseudouridine55 synthase
MVDLAAVETQAAEDRDALRAGLLRPDAALASLPAETLPAPEGERFRAGQAVQVASGGATGLVRVYAAGDEFLGVGECSDDGTLAPRRVFKSSEKTP